MSGKYPSFNRDWPGLFRRGGGGGGGGVCVYVCVCVCVEGGDAKGDSRHKSRTS